MKIGILTSSAKDNAALEETAKKRGHEVTFINPSKVLMYISEHEKGYDRFYIENETDEPTRITSSSLDCVINRIGSNTDYAASVLRFMTENMGIYCPNNAWGIILAANKAWTLQRLSWYGIKVPRTIVAESPTQVKWIVDKIGSLPIVIKTNHGSKGKTVAIVDTKRSANSMFEFVYNSGLKVLIEEFIESESSDYRVWVVGDKVAVAMKRTSVDKNDFKANISRGAKGEKVELSKEDQDLCIKAAHSIGLNVAGVDLMKSKKTGISYIIEINSNPGTKVINITGHDVFEDVVKYCEDNFKKNDLKPGVNAFFEDFLISSTWSADILAQTGEIIKLKAEVEMLRNQVKVRAFR
jgi:ribosomal protein S6--L-glutamate ligase